MRHSYSLFLGKKLDVSLLVNRKKKFRTRGGCDGALDAMRQLETDGMGKLYRLIATFSFTCFKVNELYVAET